MDKSLIGLIQYFRQPFWDALLALIHSFILMCSLALFWIHLKDVLKENDHSFKNLSKTIILLVQGLTRYLLVDSASSCTSIQPGNDENLEIGFMLHIHTKN